MTKKLACRNFFRPSLRPSGGESGVTLIEVLVTVILLGIVSMALAMNTINSLYIEKKVQLNYAQFTTHFAVWE